MTHETTTSSDGTPIAHEILGDGPAVIAVGGATVDRARMRAVAQALSDGLTVVDYDRRGRGDSGDTPPYAVKREIEDIAALIGRVGAPAHLYGHSSGAALVLRAVAAGLPVERFVLHDPPYSPDDESFQADARGYGQQIRSLLAEDRREEALETFFRRTGMPDEMIGGMRQWPTWRGLVTLAPTLAYDSAVMGDVETGGAVPADLAARAAQPALVLVGEQSPPFMVEVSRRLADLLPDARQRVLEGQGHAADPAVLAPVVVDFLAGEKAP